MKHYCGKRKCECGSCTSIPDREKKNHLCPEETLEISQHHILHPQTPAVSYNTKLAFHRWKYHSNDLKSC